MCRFLTRVALLSLAYCAGFLTITPTQAQPKRIKIILLGIFHFNQSLDSASKLHSHLFTPKRQAEIAQLVDQLAHYKPDKIFLEFSPTDQPHYDSLYQDYLNGQEPKMLRARANEIFQLGMKTAKKLGHRRAYGINYQPQELASSTYKPRNDVDQAVQNLYRTLDKFNDTTRTNAPFYDLAYPYRLPKQDSLLQASTLSGYLLHLNSANKLQRDEYSNWNFFYSLGTGQDMSSTDYVGSFWYGTNVRNFNNVLRLVDYKQARCYLLIYGSSHIPFLRYLFSMHPYFEVVDISQVLK